MPAIARNGDPIRTGHDCDQQSSVTGPTGAGAKVYINTIAVECQGDPIAAHTIRSGTRCVSHNAIINTGSPNVFVAGKPIARIGDSADRGAITGGSSNVFAGGAGSFVNTGGDSTYNGTVTFSSGGGAPSVGTTTREPPNPAPGESYIVRVTGIPDGPVTYTNPQTGQVETATAVNGKVAVRLVAPAAAVGETKSQKIEFELADGSLNSGSMVVIPDAMITATQKFQDENPTTWRETFREQYFKSIGGEQGDSVIITNPGDWAPGQFWYDYIYQNTPDLP